MGYSHVVVSGGASRQDGLAVFQERLPGDSVVRDGLGVLGVSVGGLLRLGPPQRHHHLRGNDSRNIGLRGANLSGRLRNETIAFA